MTPMRYPSSLAVLIEELKRLPGIGQVNAQRLAYHLLDAPKERTEALSRALLEMKSRIRKCAECYNLSEADLCDVCQDPGRKRDCLCVVGSPRDLMAIEGTGQYRGLYHVLGGVLSPMRGVGPDDLTIERLMLRIGQLKTREVIVATNLDVEGEATSSYLVRVLKPTGVRLTRIARGIPIGGNIENADHVTLGMALDGRIEV